MIASAQIALITVILCAKYLLQTTIKMARQVVDQTPQPLIDLLVAHFQWIVNNYYLVAFTVVALLTSSLAAIVLVFYLLQLLELLQYCNDN